MICRHQTLRLVSHMILLAVVRLMLGPVVTACARPNVLFIMADDLNDMEKDPNQFINLAMKPEYTGRCKQLHIRLLERIEMASSDI